MRYIDSVTRGADQSLGFWLQNETSKPISEIRFQSGFFSAEALGVLAMTLQILSKKSEIVHVVIGSNDAGTLGDHVRQLAELIGVPRPNANLGIVSYGNAFFHPKVYHLRRPDGSQAAYIGSANFTGPGVSSQHIEAGIIVDTVDGDPEIVLDSIANSIDLWFTESRDGFYRIANIADISRLVDERVLLAAMPPRSASTGNLESKNSTSSSRYRLKPLFELPAWPLRSSPTQPTSQPATIAPFDTLVINSVVSVPRQGFPGYLLFVPKATKPSRGIEALSGTALPGTACGLVVRINRDSGRHFEDRGGTANISVPVATLSTLRFGIFQRTHERPRAEYEIYIRYCCASNILKLSHPANTNVMAYGFTPGEVGHGDVRMLVPTAVKELRDNIRLAGLEVPATGDLALLEWPSITAPEFRLSYLERGSPIEQKAQQLFDKATRTNELVGDGACWLPPGISPTW